jgi:hypothetical protein
MKFCLLGSKDKKPLLGFNELIFHFNGLRQKYLPTWQRITMIANNVMAAIKGAVTFAMVNNPRNAPF